MSLLTTVNDYLIKDEGGERAAFEAAFNARVNKDGYRLIDLVFELYKAQRAIADLEDNVLRLRAEIK